MTNTTMSHDEERDFYAGPTDHVAHGPIRRRSKPTGLVPVRFPPEILEEVRHRAGVEDRSVSSWIRRAVEHELKHQIG